jgi:hypothetical protein
MISEQPKSPPGLPLTINFKIPAYWTPEQALAVFELLDDLRQRNIAEWKSSPLWRRPQLSWGEIRAGRQSAQL